MTLKSILSLKITISALAMGLMTISPTLAQSIAVDQLGEAQAFDAGVLSARTGGLDAALWQGTNAATAAQLLEDAPLNSGNRVVQDLIIAAALSGGVPPAAQTEDEKARFNRAKIKAIVQFGDKADIEQLLFRNPELGNDPQIKAEIALSQGQIEDACLIADSVQDGRARPEWARLRGFCHITRDELPAAELTRNILRTSGYKNPCYHTLMDSLLTGGKTGLKIKPSNIDTDDVLLAVMAKTAGLTDMAPVLSVEDTRNPDLPKTDRLQALWDNASQMEDDEISAVLSDLSFDDADLINGLSFDLETAEASPAPKKLGLLFAMAKSGGDPIAAAQAISEIIMMAEKSGVKPRFDALLTPYIQALPAEAQAAADLSYFAKAALTRADIGNLQGLYQSLDENPKQQARIALAADALGNGFILGELGKDIETRLGVEGDIKRRAVRDTALALALGARFTSAAAQGLSGEKNGAGRGLAFGDRAALQSAAAAGSRAETALRTAAILGQEGITAMDNAAAYDLIRALTEVGLSNYARRLAAEDFLSDL